MARKSVDEYYLDIAREVSTRSTCLRIHYGAVLVKNNCIISTGYNGAASGYANCNDLGVCIRDELKVPHGERYELCRSVHAEANAIIQAHPDQAEGSILYLYGIDAKTGKPLNYNNPCEMCKRNIRNAKIAEVVSYQDGVLTKINPSKWIAEDLERYTKLRLEYGIKKEKVDD